jgi:outer membrane receptor protein involved in Fe transport
MAGKRLHVIAVLMASVACGFVPQCAAASDRQVYQFDLPAQDLGDALRAVAAKAGWELYASADDLNGVPAPRLRGTFTAREAVERLVRGTSLSVRFDKGAVIVRGRSAVAAGNGDEKDIIVTGTHIRGASPSEPVRIIRNSEIEAQGFSDLGELARSVPQNFGGGQNPGVAGGGNRGVGNENSSSSSALNLRGLGPAATLTLLNGHRLAYDTVAQGVDLSQIPMMAVDRVEIVTDGASALYGSDAVGGVANLILRRDYEGLLTSARIGGSLDGGGTQQKYDVLAGHRWGSGGGMLAVSFSDVSATTAGQRNYTRNLDPSSTLVPWQRQISVLGAAHQRITDNLSVEADAQFNRRLTELAAPSLTTSDVRTNGLLSQPVVTSGTVNATLQWTVGNGWTATAAGTYGVSNNHIFSRRFTAAVETLRTQLNYDNSVAVGEAGAEGPLFEMPGGSARLAVGGGYRRVGLDVLIIQTTGGATRTTTDITSGRSVFYGYGELSLPLVGKANARPFLNELRVDLAGRYEDYPGNAHLLTPKIGLVYAPDPIFTIRLNWGKSFKTQTLYQQYQAQQGVLLAARTFQSPPSAQPVLIIAGGNPNLRPEKAETWSAGATLAPADGLTLDATYFNIRYRDRVVSPLTSIVDVFTNPIYRDYILLSPSAVLVSAAVAELPNGLTNASGAPFDPAAVGAIVDSSLQNAARQSLQGVDLSGRYRIGLPRGNFILLEGYVSFLKSNQQLSPGRPILQLAGTIFNPPHWRGRGGVTWKRDNVTLSAFGSYIGGTVDTRYVPHTHVGGFTTLDLVGQLRTTASTGPFAGLKFEASIGNLFDARPSIIRNSITTDPPYDSTNYSVTGRTISLSISKEF